MNIQKLSTIDTSVPGSSEGIVEPGRIDVMADRLGRLERAYRRWRLAGIGMGSCLLLLVGMAAVRGPGTVEAEQFILKDAKGTMRATWTMRADQTPGLCLFDTAGNPRLSLDLAQDGTPGVNLYGPDRALRAAVAVRRDGTPGLCLADPAGKIRLSLDLGNDGSTGVNLFGEAGRPGAALAIRGDGTPALGLFDEQGAVRRSIEIGADDKPAPRPAVRPVP